MPLQGRRKQQQKAQDGHKPPDWAHLVTASRQATVREKYDPLKAALDKGSWTPSSINGSCKTAD